MKFILTRHTSTEWDESGRLKGHKDAELSEKGILEAEELAQKLMPLGAKLIISSDLKRALKTAEIINLKLGAAVKRDENLRECSFGKLEGLTMEEISEKYGPSASSQASSNDFPYDFKPYGGEDYETVLSRHLKVVKGGYEDISGPILLVGHSLGMSTLLHGLGLPPTLEKDDYRVIEV